jgi:hypothetical protein
MQRIGLERCPRCRSTAIYASRIQGFRDVAGMLFLLRPVRCHRCMLRHFRPLFVRTLQDPERAMVLEVPFRQIRSTKQGGHRAA